MSTNPMPPSGVRSRPRTRCDEGFTLLELLVVIAIIGILAAIAVPTMNAFKPNVIAAATQQLLADVGRARQLAIAERTTVYMVFVPTNFYNAPAYAQLPLREQQKGDKLLDKQYVGYNFVCLRSLGDQPGSPTPRYLSAWRVLPEGAFIPFLKFNLRDPNVPPFPITNHASGRVYYVRGFERTNNIPFPSAEAPGYVSNDSSKPSWVPVPYIAFNYLGQLESGSDEVIPLARGSVLFGRDKTKTAIKSVPSFLEVPPGNATNSSFNLVYIDALTGRGHIERQEVK